MRLFTTLMRFDPVYYGHFKCNRRRIVDYPNLWGFVRDVYQMPGIAETVHIDFIKRHYYGSHANIEPDRASCRSAPTSTSKAHGRERLAAEQACRPLDSRRTPGGSLSAVFITNGP